MLQTVYEMQISSPPVSLLQETVFAPSWALCRDKIVVVTVFPHFLLCF
jgi:hypothetical protein